MMNADEMLKAVLSGKDFYNPLTHTYVFAYSDTGSIYIHRSLNPKEATNLAIDSNAEGKPWSAYLRTGGNVYDGTDALNWIEDNVSERWISTEEYPFAMNFLVSSHAEEIELMKLLEEKNYIWTSMQKPTDIPKLIKQSDFDEVELCVRADRRANTVTFMPTNVMSNIEAAILKEVAYTLPLLKRVIDFL